MDKQNFLALLQAEAAQFNAAVSTSQGDWVVDLLQGTGPFTELGEAIFDDYWMYYLTQDMARAIELPRRPYVNLKTYKAYKGLE